MTCEDPKSGEQVPVFHPCQQDWKEHFRWAEFRVIGRFPTGRAAVELLRMNREIALAIRAEDARLGWHPAEQGEWRRRLWRSDLRRGPAPGSQLTAQAFGQNARTTVARAFFPTPFFRLVSDGSVSIDMAPLDCGGKRSATPPWMDRWHWQRRSWQPRKNPKRCRRCTLPPHSLALSSRERRHPIEALRGRLRRWLAGRRRLPKGPSRSREIHQFDRLC